MSNHLLLAITAIAPELGQEIALQRTEIAELRREHKEIKNSFLSKGSVAVNLFQNVSAETKEKMAAAIFSPNDTLWSTNTFCPILFWQDEAILNALHF